MGFQHIEVEPVAGALGAEVSGVDLTKALADEVVAEIQEAWLQHKVLFFRDQPVTVEQQKAFARNFGELHIHPVLQQMADEGHPEVVVLESDERRPYVAHRWHSDVTFEKAPPNGSILHAVAVPDTGGDTLWASMTAAWDALSDAMQRLLSGLEALHDGGGFKRIAFEEERRKDLERRQTAVHPVVRTHPETGAKVLFVNATFTKSIVGMHPAESRALLDFLFRHIENPDFQVRFRWRKDSIAMWDNRCTQHRVVQDNVPAYRRMERITLIGEAPYA